MNLTSEENLKRIIDLVESQENKARIEKHYADYEITFGNQYQYILSAMKEKYKESWNTMSVMDIKISNKIIRKLSKCYSNGVVREVVNKKTKEKNENVTNLLNVIYSDIDETNRDFNLVMDRFNEYHTNHRYSELFTFIDEETGKIRFRPLPQHLFTSIPNKTKTKADMIIFKQEVCDFIDVKDHIDWQHIGPEFYDSQVESVYTIWTKDKNLTIVNLKKEVIDDETKKSEIIYKIASTSYEDNPEGINPIGMMPFCMAKDATDGHFYPWGSEIPHMSKEINVATSDILSIANQQGFGQAVIYYDADHPPETIKTGPTHVIHVPNKSGNSKFEFANPNPDLAGHLSIATNITRMLLSTNDLTTDKVSGELQATNFASAIDRLIADSETIENIQNQRRRFIGIEKQQMRIVLAFCRYLKSINQWPGEYPEISISELNDQDYDLIVHFNSIKPMITEKEKVDTIKSMDEAGLIFPWEKHTKFNEQLTEKEAIEREKMIQEQRTEKAQEAIKSKADLINSETDDDAEEDINGNQSIQNDKLTQNPTGRQGETQRPKNTNYGRPNQNRQYYSRENSRTDAGRDWRYSPRTRV